MATLNANLPKSGYTAGTANNYLLNAGALVRDLEWNKEEEKWSYTLVGATSGGSKITLKNNLRQVVVDGVMTTPEGGDVIESSEAIFEINLIEHTLENLKQALFAKSTASDGETYPLGYDVVKPKGQIEASDYITNLGYIGTVSGSDKPIIVIMHKAICTTGYEIEPKDKAEAIYKIAYAGRTAKSEAGTSALPVTILMPKANALPEGFNATTPVDGAPEGNENGGNE